MKIGYVSNNPITTNGGIGNFLFKLIYGLTESDSTVQPMFFFKPEPGKTIESNFTFILSEDRINETIASLNSMDVVHWNWGVTESDDEFIMNIFRSITVPIITTIHSLQLVEQEYYQDCIDTYFNHVPNTSNFMTYYDQSAKNQIEFIERSNVTVFISNNEKQHADRLGIKPRKSIVIYNSIDTVPIDYANIKQTKHTGIFSRLVYRKGILAAMTAIDSMPETTLTIHGGYGDPFALAMVNSFLKNPRIQAKGELKGFEQQKQFFSEISLMFGNSLYEPFGYSHVESMQLGVFPIIGANTGTVEIFGEDYPFIVKDDVNDLKQKINLYYSMSIDQLHELAQKIELRLQEKSIELFLSSYKQLYEATCLQQSLV